MYFTLEVPNPYDESLRRRVIRAYEAGEGTYDELAALFDVAARTINRWVAFGSAPRAPSFPCPRAAAGPRRS